MTNERVVTFRLVGHGNADPSPLPIAIVDTGDQVVASGSLTTRTPLRMPVTQGVEPLFARVRLPNGRNLIEPLSVAGHWRTSVRFSVGEESPHEWMAWSAARLDLRRRSDERLIDHPGMTRAWMQLWELDPGASRWRQRPIAMQGASHADEALQVELPPVSCARALVVDLGTEGPRVFSLPRGKTRVLVTTAPTLASDAAPRVLVGGYGAAAEGILEFLRQGSMGAAGTVLDPGNDLAKSLLQEKMADPIAAVAAAYYLLRKCDWERMPQPWLNNLANWFPAIPDAHLLRDVSLIQRGMEAASAARLAAQTLKQALANGWPLFAEAIGLLEELLIYAEGAKGPSTLSKEQRRLLRAMLGCARPAGLTFGFLGDSPVRPAPPWQGRVDGHPDTSRPPLRDPLGLRYVQVDFAAPRPIRHRSLVEQLVARSSLERVLLPTSVQGTSLPRHKDATLFVGDLYGVPRRVSREVASAVSGRYTPVVLG